MSLLYTGYNALTSGVFLACFPPFWLYSRLSGRFQKGLKERLGIIPRGSLRKRAGSPRIWIHAASLGEVKVAGALVEHLSKQAPGCEVVLSTNTDHGHALATETFKGAPVIYAPVDFIAAVRKALSIVRPDVMVFLETEIWPSWLTEACRRGIKTGLVNGRISMRSVKRYRKFRSFFTEVLRNVDAFSMIMKEDASRIIGMGARPERVEINGNAKYDLLTKEADPAVEGEVRKILNLQPYQHVFVAGSTREGEEETVLDVYETVLKHFPDMVLIIAPRHIIRTAAIGSLLKSRGLEYQLRTELKAGGPVRKAPVIIMNTFGELFRFYSVGSINFCGASLVPLGGQNPLEAAVWSKVVFYGPHMEDFLDAKALLEKEEAGIEVSNAEAFAAKAVWFLSHPDSAKHHGMKAKDAIVRNQGAAEKHAKVIIRLLDQRNSTMSGSRGGSP